MPPTKSSRRLPFSKLHGLGNDFVLLDFREPGQSQKLTPQDMRFISDRKRGVGFDQLLILRASPRVHAVLDIFNADGTLAEMCGNGLRAAALYLWSRGLKDQTLIVETCAGDRQARLLGPLDEGFIETEMGVPKFPRTPATLSRGVPLNTGKSKKTHHPILVNVGNPHAVFLTPAPDDQRLKEWGSRVETHKAFPKRTNVEFVDVNDSHLVKAKVWERGVGITEACGTGGVAVAVACIRQGLCKSPVEVQFPGGAVEVVWEGLKKPAYLRGHATAAFEGVLVLP